LTPLFRFEVFQTDPTSFTQTGARLVDAAQKSRIVFEPNLFHTSFANCAGHESALQFSHNRQNLTAYLKK
jgi:hypothetical protein